ncbi:argininosuccinate synthase [Actinokineospora sp. UTMC 2448]|uniref:argininosuccinate synthase n=1 Tax=Actinokineospora sp. UTMC 2448 TaxID=2268449 RepID=UPI0021646601|nr:argininosuccinate synthase [Actinokineospora sp. UTMC 2448]UVS81023.1 Argininosuccinate synthase [Actinokineospora sp. UTMC 2448]
MKIVLAYSGGLDTSLALAWLRRTYDAEVVAFCANLGQVEDLGEAEARAKANGATSVYVEDLRHEFLTDYAFRALRADAVFETRYHMAASLSRPLIAKRLVEIAKAENAHAVAHGATGKGNDQVRFFAGIAALAPELRVIAPVMEWDLTTRARQIAFAEENAVSIPAFKSSPYSRDTNIWGTSVECGPLDDIALAPPEEVYTITRSPESAPDRPLLVRIGFENGVPCLVDGERLDPVTLVRHLNQVAGEHGVGRIDIMENRLVGIKVRGVYEAPAAAVLYEAHRELENLVLERDLFQYKALLSKKYAELVYDAKWFSALRGSLDAFFDDVRRRVTGEVTVKLYKGSATVVARQSENSLYHLDFASYESEAAFDHSAGTGFSYIWSMPGRVSGLRGAIG